MKWDHGSHVHVDRAACPWLITRFVDNEAEFLFVPANQIEKVVKKPVPFPSLRPALDSVITKTAVRAS